MLTWDSYKKWLGDAAKGPTPAPPAPDVAALATDTRTLGPGQWFVPIKGPSFDGHGFIEEAVRRGASGFFYEAQRAGEVPATIRSKGLAVSDSLLAFQRAASGWRRELQSLRLLALTGSTGKTTTKEMLSRILRTAGPTLATQASFNNEIGVPKTLQSLRPEHRYAALEFGARMPGNIRFLCEMAAPDVVGLVNVGVAHLGIFGSVEALLNTKLEIFRDSPNHAVQVAYHDDPRILAGARGTGKRTLSFGRDPAADVRLLGSDWQLEDGTMRVRLGLPGGRQLDIPFDVAHEALPLNAAAATALALAADVEVDAIEQGLAHFSGVKGRYLVHRGGPLTIVDDTYNANPASMAAGLATVARAFAGRRQILVLGDMLELGDGSTEEHHKVGSQTVARMQPALLVTVGPEARHIARGAVASGLPEARVRSYDTVDALLAAGLDFAKFGDTLYAKGSNGIRLSQLVDKLLDQTGRN